MNEKIKELEDQCWEDIGGNESYFNRYKFAELIILECMMLNHNHFSDEDPYSIDSLYKHHFGIEE